MGVVSMTDDRGHDWSHGTCLRCGLSQQSGAADLDLPCAVTANDCTDPWTVSGDALDVSHMTESLYLIWSMEHKAWWRPERLGYTEHLHEAGGTLHSKP